MSVSVIITAMCACGVWVLVTRSMAVVPLLLVNIFIGLFFLLIQFSYGVPSRQKSVQRWHCISIFSTSLRMKVQKGEVFRSSGDREQSFLQKMDWRPYYKECDFFLIAFLVVGRNNSTGTAKTAKTAGTCGIIIIGSS